MTMSPPGHRTLILGGARSGKSRLAERIVTETGRNFGWPLVYIATAEARDADMAARIQNHRSRRGDGWRTVEAPFGLAAELREAGQADCVILVDCLTLWLSNHLLRDGHITLPAAATELTAALQSVRCPVVLVSNEVGLGIVPDNQLARQFRDAAGSLHQTIAAVADTVLFVAAGLPLALKGQLAPWEG